MIPEPIAHDASTEPSAPPEGMFRVATTWRARPQGPDLVLLAAVLGLLAIGTIEIYSASAVYAEKATGSSTFFLQRHLIYCLLGFAALWFGATLDHGRLARWSFPLLLGAITLLAGVLVAGTRVGGAKRWFHLGPLSFQPVEFAKIALVAYLAHSLAQREAKVKSFTVGFLPHLAVCGAMMALLLGQPDLGSALILGATTLILLFVAGTRLSYILLAVMAASPVIYFAIVGTPWRLRRMIAYVDPWQFRQGVGYQITESLISIGSGGLAGLGLGDGKQKLFYMPEAHTDFIMANVGEELGFLGFALVLALFAVVLWRGTRAALGARDRFGTYLAFGLTSIFALQALVNTGVVLGALPAKGLTLPFMSYGGSSLVLSLFCVGVLLNVSTGRPAPAPAPRRRIQNERARNRHHGHRVHARS